MNRLEIRHVEAIAYQLAIKWMGTWEPIPSFTTRFPEKLESSLNTPFQTYAKKALYPTLSDKAAILFYLMVKNHPFQNLPAPHPEKYQAYVLECNDKTLYKGHAKDLGQRLKKHQNGAVVWTAPRRPVKLLYFEEFNTREEAIKREKELKTGFGRKWLRKKIDELASRQAGGNKRIALTTLLTFLAFNKKWLKISNQELYHLAVKVASSDPREKDKIIPYVRGVIELELTDL